MKKEKVGEEELLTREETTALNIRRLAGDPKARDEMILRNKGLVVSKVLKFRDREHPDFYDFVQDGLIGLIKAVDQFNHEDKSGASLATYAYWPIKNEIYRSHNKKSRTIRISHGTLVEIRKVQGIAKELEQKLERRPTINEISEKSGFTFERINSLFQYALYTLSLDAPLPSLVDDNPTSSKYALIENTAAQSPTKIIAALDEGVEAVKLLKDLRDHVGQRFGPRNQMIFLSRFGLFGYGDKKTLLSVAKIFGVSKAYVGIVCQKVFRVRSYYKRPLTSNTEVYRAIDCLQRAMEISYELNGKITDNLREVIGSELNSYYNPHKRKIKKGKKHRPN